MYFPTYSFFILITDSNTEHNVKTHDTTGDKSVVRYIECLLCLPCWLTETVMLYRATTVHRNAMSSATRCQRNIARFCPTRHTLSWRLSAVAGTRGERHSGAGARGETQPRGERRATPPHTVATASYSLNVTVSAVRPIYFTLHKPKWTGTMTI